MASEEIKKSIKEDKSFVARFVEIALSKKNDF